MVSPIFRRFLPAALVATALLAVGYVRTAEGTKHPTPWGYRTWSFGALAYSDILALHEDRGAGRHLLPYLEDRVEYPVLMGLGMWGPSVVAPGRAGYFALTYLLLAVCALGALWFMAAIPGTNPWAFAASPALLVYAGLNWDLFAILPLAAGVYLWVRGRERAAVAVLSLAVWTKFFPLLVLGILLLTVWRRSLPLLGVFLAVTLLVNLPFALAARDNWLWFFRYSSIREIEPSIYLLLGADPRAAVPLANALSALVTLLGAAALALVQLRTGRLDPFKAAFGLVCLFFIANKVYSPQYWLWVLALAAIASVPGSLAAVVSCAALADFVSSFMRLHLQFERVWQQAQWYDQHVFWPMVALRCGVLAACVAWAFSRVLRPPEAAIG